jgi:hypothetical protein
MDHPDANGRVESCSQIESCSQRITTLYLRPRNEEKTYKNIMLSTYFPFSCCRYIYIVKQKHSAAEDTGVGAFIDLST